MFSQRKKILPFTLCFFVAMVCLFGVPVAAVSAEEVSPDKKSPPPRKHYNRLVHEKSPYLQQHAKNPIHWFAWGEEAFAAAWAESKPIFLSIGYSTCHWCHVMETKTFENHEVAALLNEGFISIKVDREELPDVDQFYMSVVQAMTGRGGWPMTVVMTPDLIPFFGGTYFPAEKMTPILRSLKSGWENQPERISAIGDQVRKFLDSQNRIKGGTTTLDEAILKKMFAGLSARFDAVHGGFGTAPKFPPTTRLKVLLRIARRTGDKKALSMVESTLDHMARGGIYDHLGGGFHRYSTDPQWRVPHFEKMLYDQAALASIYLEGFQVTGKKMYEQVARGILDYVLRELNSPQGGFYSAEDADSEGEEGTFYLWRGDELQKILSGDEIKRIRKIYGTRSKGNAASLGPGINLLHLQPEHGWEIKSDPQVKALHKKMFAHREKRERPFKDDKIVTSWNGLMIASMARAYQVLGDRRYLKAAQQAAGFIKERLYLNEKLVRRYRLGEAKHAASLDDYGYLIHGLINLYEADFDEGWIQWARALQKKQDLLFWDGEDGGYYFSESNSNSLPMRRKAFADGARPNSNAVSVLNLLQLYNLTFDEAYQQKARKIFQLIGDRMNRSPQGYGQMLVALDYYLDRSKEVAVLGPKKSPNKDAIIKMLRTSFIPNKVLAYLPPNTKTDLPLLKDKYTENDTTIVYVCENNVCKYPTGDLAKVKEIVEQRKPYSLD